MKTALLSLSVEERESLLAEIENETKQHSPVIGNRRELLNNKKGYCLAWRTWIKGTGLISSQVWENQEDRH